MEVSATAFRSSARHRSDLLFCGVGRYEALI